MSFEEDCASVALLSDDSETCITKSSSLGKLLHLQGMRGIAILAVILFHFFPTTFSNGYLGVDIFFALSGFLMAMMLSKCSSLGMTEVCDFLYRRVKRIVPLYYFCTLTALISMFFFTDLAVLRKNIESVTNALLFATNLIRPESSEELEEAADMFTHTWSLALEMQFYLLFPFIFGVYRHLPPRWSSIFWTITSTLSFVFYWKSDSFMSFNSVMARVWQFNAGTFAYLQSQPGPEIKREDTSSLTLCLILLLGTPTLVDADFSRVLTTLLSLYLLQFGAGSRLLESKELVFLGEISYSWYLIHWPFAAYCKYTKMANIYFVTGILVITLLYALVLHYTFEKPYLRWDKKVVVFAVVVLCLLNGAALYKLREKLEVETFVSELDIKVVHENTMGEKTKFNYASDFDLDIVYGYENKSKEELLKLNEHWKASDWERTMLFKLCPKFEDPEERLCQQLNPEANQSLLVIGNSYASNVMPVIFDECHHLYSKMEIFYRGGLESLSLGATINPARSQEWKYVEAVKKFQPDVLFVIQRHMSLLALHNGSSPFNDKYFEQASERLAEMELYVKKRIYILDDFPEIVSAWDASQKAIETGIAPDDNVLNVQTLNNLIGRMRIQRLVSECSKCKAYDHTAQMFFNGTFKFYDPVHYMSFVTEGRHLTPAGWERVRPLYRHLCSKL